IWFQSSSNPKVGCYVRNFNPEIRTARVSILIQPEGWMLRRRGTAPISARSSFNPHPTRRLDATRRHAGDNVVGPVSLLIQPEGWMLRAGAAGGARGAAGVSILIQPEGWMLPRKEPSL